MAKLNISHMVALMAAVKGAVSDETLRVIVEASNKAAEAKELGKEVSEQATAGKGSLLDVLRKVAGDIASREGWTPEHFEVAMGLAVEAGANEESVKPYASTLRNLIVASQRKTDPIPVASITDPALKYKDLRLLLKSDEDKAVQALRDQLKAEAKLLTRAELEAVLQQVQQVTQPRAAAKEAAKAKGMAPAPMKAAA